MFCNTLEEIPIKNKQKNVSLKTAVAAFPWSEPHLSNLKLGRQEKVRSR